jgi:hypothetical protein
VEQWIAEGFIWTLMTGEREALTGTLADAESFLQRYPEIDELLKESTEKLVRELKQRIESQGLVAAMEWFDSLSKKPSGKLRRQHCPTRRRINRTVDRICCCPNGRRRRTNIGRTARLGCIGARLVRPVAAW